MYCVDMVTRLTFDMHAEGRPYYAERARWARTRPPTRSDHHWHSDFAEIFLVTEGRGTHLLTGDDRSLKPGDLVIVRPRDRHAFSAVRSMQFINVAFPREAWDAFCVLMRGEIPHWWELEAEPPTYHFGETDYEQLASIFERVLVRFFDSPSMLDLIDFWTGLLRFLAEAQEDTEHTASVPAWLAQACSLMHQEDNLRAGLPRLVTLAGVSNSHLSRSMKAYLATTPTEFVSSVRLEHAAVLLGSTTSTVTAVAHRCGFSSQAYFTRCFTQARGISPREYRRNAQRAFVP